MSLLSNAKKIQLKRRRSPRKEITNDEKELAIAVLTGEISILVASKVLNIKSPNGCSYRVLVALQNTYSSGYITINKLK